MLTRLLVSRFTSQYCLYKNLGAPNPVQKVSLEPCLVHKNILNVDFGELNRYAYPIY